MKKINNQSNAAYSFTIDPEDNPANKSAVSNNIEVNLLTPSLLIEKSVDKGFATLDDVLTYTIKLTNNGDILLRNIVITDVIGEGVSFTPGSVTLNGSPLTDANITTGITIDSIILLGVQTITFKATVESVPTSNKIDNKASATYEYLLSLLKTGTSESNVVTTLIKNSILNIIKTSSATDVEAGDTITYTHVITNSGNELATNIMFQDVLNDQITFVTGTVKIDNVTFAQHDPVIGFSIDDMMPSSTVTIEFKTLVNE